MDESRKRASSTVNNKNMSSSLDEDFGNDFLSSWKLPKSGEDTIDFNVESVPKGTKKFSFDSLDDFGLDGAFDKLSSFQMGMPGLDFSSPVKKKVKHKSSNGDDLSKGKKETEKDFSFSFDFNELGKFNLDAKLGLQEKSLSTVTGKINPVSSEANKYTQIDLSAKGTDTRDENRSKEQTQTQDTCTLKPSHPTRQESIKNGSHLTPNVNADDTSDVMQEQHTSVSPSRMEQSNIAPVSNDRLGEHSMEAYPSKAPVNKYFQNVSSSAVSVEDPTQVSADPVNSKEAPKVDFSEVHVSREGNDNEQSVCSQSRNTSTVNPNISRRSLSQLASQNEVEENVSHNEVSQDNLSFSSNPRLSTRRSCGTKNSEEGTSAPKGLSSLVQREIRNIGPSQENKTGTFSLLSKSANMKLNRIELASETLKKSAGESKVINKMDTHPTDLQREHKQANAGTDKSRTALSKTYIKPALHGLLTNSMNINDAKNAKLGPEPPSARKLSQLNTRSSPASSAGLKIVPNHVVLKSSYDSDSMQGTQFKDDKTPAISQLTGRRTAMLGIRSPKPRILLEKESVEAGAKGSPITTSRILTSIPKGKSALLSPSIMQKESVLDPKAPTVLKHIMRSPAVRKSPQTVLELRNQTEISSVMACEMADISDLELPALLENDGNVEKAEACRKELENICILLKRKHAEAKELEVRAIINNNMMLMLNHPMFEEKICSLQKFANTLRSKKYLFEEVGTIDSH